MSGISLLHCHLTGANRQTLLNRAAYQSKRQIEELLAELFPKPDVPTSIRKLPERQLEAKPTRMDELGPDRVGPRNSEPEPVHPGAQKPVGKLGELARARPALVKPFAPARYKIEFTASAELRSKLERLRALMRSSVPDGDLATLIEQAVTEKLERLESKRFGKTKAPRNGLEQTHTTPSSRYITATVRRAVHERDQGQCTFVDENGRRCAERDWLEFHHRRPFGRGGEHSVENIRLV